MTDYLHRPVGLAPLTTYRVDTGATNNTTALITRVDPRAVIDASRIRTDGAGAAPAFIAVAATVYLRPLDYRDTPGAAITSAGSVYPAPDTGGTGSGQAADDDLTTIAGLDSTQAGVIASDGAGWARKSYAALLTAIGAAPVASPGLTGTPTVPTAAAGTNTTQAASTAFVRGEVAALVASAPSALDTLNELATSLGNDAAFATTVTNALAAKAPLASPAFTGTPAAPTPAAGDASTKVATTAYVAAAAFRPSTQGTGRAGLWDPTRGVYNLKPTNTRAARAGMAAAVTAAGTFFIDCIGDSTTAGTGATGATSYPAVLRAKLAAATGLTCRPGMMLPGQSPSEWSPTLGSGWISAAVGWADAAAYAANSGSGNLSLSADNCTGFKVTYVTKGTFTVAIDSGSTTTVTTNNADAIATATYSAGSAGTHTIDIAATGGTAYIVGIEPLYAAGTISISNLGLTSKTSSNWASSAVGYGSIACLQSRTATRLTLINLGINDANGGGTTSTLTTKLGLIIAAVRAAGSDPVLIVPTPPTGTSSTWNGSYPAAIYDAADAADCPLLDMTYRWTDHASSSGFKDDSFHPNAAGYADMAKAVAAALTQLL